MPDVEGEEAPLGERPASGELALNVAQARIAAKLFGSTGEVTVGRYKLLELVGRGGMGLVWGAWDHRARTPDRDQARRSSASRCAGSHRRRSTRAREALASARRARA